MTTNDSDLARNGAAHQKGGSVSACGASAASSAGRPGFNGIGFEIEDDLWRAAALNDVAMWIGRAKHILKCIERAADRDEALKLGLSSHGVGVIDAEWHDYHADGLDVLHMTVDDHLRAVRQISGIERRRDGAGCTTPTSSSSAATRAPA